MLKLRRPSPALVIALLAGAKAVSGGFTSPNVVLATDTHRTSDGAGWTVDLINLSASASAGNVQAVCVG